MTKEKIAGILRAVSTVLLMIMSFGNIGEIEFLKSLIDVIPYLQDNLDVVYEAVLTLIKFVLGLIALFTEADHTQNKRPLTFSINRFDSEYVGNKVSHTIRARTLKRA